MNLPPAKELAVQHNLSLLSVIQKEGKEMTVSFDHISHRVLEGIHKYLKGVLSFDELFLQDFFKHRVDKREPSKCRLIH